MRVILVVRAAIVGSGAGAEGGAGGGSWARRGKAASRTAGKRDKGRMLFCSTEVE